MFGKCIIYSKAVNLIGLMSTLHPNTNLVLTLTKAL